MYNIEMPQPLRLFVVVLVVPDDYCQSVYNVGSNQSYYIPGAGGVLSHMLSGRREEREILKICSFIERASLAVTRPILLKFY